jgi:biliverdin reductase/flavin reductase
MTSIAVFRATGGTGRQIVVQGLEAGHQIAVLVRDPAKLEMTHAHLKVVTGNVLNPKAVWQTLQEADAEEYRLAIAQTILMKLLRLR